MKKFKMMVLVVLFMLLSVNAVWGETIKLVWDSNTETDLAGYKVYSSETDGGPYMLVNDVGNLTELELDLTAKPDGTVYYVATAYDQRGNESIYSNQANYVIDHTPPAAPGGCTIKLNW